MPTMTRTTFLTLATTPDERFYLIRGDEALGPLPMRWSEQEDTLPTILIHEALEVLGLAWGPLPCGWYPDDPEGLTEAGVWYLHVAGPTGGRYVQRTLGFTRALDAFLASPEAARLLALAGPRPRGAVPFVRLHADGRYETGTDAAAEPVLLTLQAYRDPRVLHRELRWALDERTWPEPRD